MMIYLSMIEDDARRVTFEQIYNKYRRLMFHIAFSILEDEGYAEDAVHDAFLSVIPYLSRLPGVDDPRTKSFVASVARCRAIDIQRKRRGTLYLDDVGDIAISDDHSSPEELLSGLPEPYRGILLMRYGMGLKVKDISKLTCRSTDSIYNIIKKAKAMLSQILEKEEN
ncbi:MAG: sigma-70 family RNA polymerase sigma factor [Clostridia bacterium]|nr:sigma-70 family RNA polymerase sigma factor [Clostridia bacterium]